MPGLLDGRVALITGAGSGIGEATAIASPMPDPAPVTSAIVPTSKPGINSSIPTLSPA